MFDTTEGLERSFDKLMRYTRLIYLMASATEDDCRDFDYDDIHTLLMPIMDGLDKLAPFFETGEKFINAWEKEIQNDLK